MPQQELQVQRKRELEKKQERTIPSRIFLPVTDIFETAEALMVVMELPGVRKESVEIGVENDVLLINGQIDFSKYEALQPLYTEYNIGNYSRSFQISSKIDQDSISAELKDGVLTLVLPKAERQDRAALTSPELWRRRSVVHSWRDQVAALQ